MSNTPTRPTLTDIQRTLFVSYSTASQIKALYEPTLDKLERELEEAYKNSSIVGENAIKETSALRKERDMFEELSIKLDRELAEAKALLDDHGPNGRNVTNEQHEKLRLELVQAKIRMDEAFQILSAARRMSCDRSDLAALLRIQEKAKNFIKP